MSLVIAPACVIVGKLTYVRKLAEHNATPRKASPKPVVITKGDIDQRVIIDDDEQEMIGDHPEDHRPQVNSMSHGASAGLLKFEVLKGIAAPMERANVDTDAVIPKQFLKTIKRTGLGTALFHQLRYKEDGSEKEFLLNQGPYRKANIPIVTGPTFLVRQLKRTCCMGSS